VRRTAFLGTPESALPVLRALTAASDLRVVVTRPDKVRGRGTAPTPTPVKQAAVDLGIAVGEPRSKAELGALLADLGLDLAVVAAFGMILPLEVLAIPERGMVNVHYSLLPRWRGAAPVERAVLAGDAKTGITLMQMDEGLDTGPVLASWATTIETDESGGHLTSRLAEAAGELLAVELDQMFAGTHTARPQKDAEATYAAMLRREEAILDPREPAEALVRKIRAFDPRPGARFERAGHPFKVFGPVVLPGTVMEPGRLALDEGRLLVGTGTVGLAVAEVQPSGKRRMSAEEWARGVRDGLGELT